MATIVDALLVTLSLDTTAFRRGQKQNTEDLSKSKEEANAAAKSIEASGKQAAAFFGRLRNEALLLFAALTGANTLKQFVENITTSDASMSRLAKQLNMSTEDLTAWANAIERSGGSVTEATSTLQGLESQIQQFRLTGNSSVVPYFRAMGVALTDGYLHARPLKDILLDLAKWAEGRDPAMVAQMFRSIGLDQGTINALLKGRDAVAALVDQSKALGVTSDADGQRAQMLQERWRALEQAATSLGRTILNDLSPAIIKVLGAMGEWIQSHRALIDTGIDKAVQAILVQATNLYHYLQTVDWGAVWKTLIEWVVQVQLQFLAFFDYLQDHWPEIKKSASDFAETVRSIVIAVNKVVEATLGWGKMAEFVLAAWAVGKLTPLIVGLNTILSLLGGITVAAMGLSGKGAAGLFGGMLGKAALAAVVADLGVTALDPNDLVGTWIDKNIPGAGYLDDLSARYLGIGRSYDQQDTAAKAAGYGGMSRGIRNNNPLNLEYRPDQGASSSDGRFGIYGTMEGGIAAASHQLMLYQDRDHLNTIRSIVSKWAPSNDNNDTEGYVRQVSGMLNVDPDTQLDLHDRNMMSALIMAMAKRESGAKLSPDMVLRSIAPIMPPPPANDTGPVSLQMRNPVRDLTTGAAASPAVQNSTTSTTNTSTSEINVNGPITLNTQATDAKGVAAGLIGGLKSSLKVQQANSGLN